MSNKSSTWYGVNLASERLGAKAIYASDDFFAPKERMLQDQDAVFIEGKYDDNGKWMDGWESRRKRSEGYDFCIVKLGVSGQINALDIDTRHFTGNYPPAALVQACYSLTDPDADTNWIEITDTVALQGNQQHIVHVESDQVFTHVKLNIFPDGGVARLRVYGQPDIDWQAVDTSKEIDLLALVHGGRAIATNDEHFGSMHNLNLPGKSLNMGDGWETRRRREPGNDWVIMALGHPGEISSIQIETSFFKGNFPDSCAIQFANIDDLPDSSLAAQSLYWQELLPKQPLKADNEHLFQEAVLKVGRVTHIRLNIFPDGGISRVRLFGKPSFD
ncbi:allantoicase [Marinomonas sp. 15G1-11]|uniref:Probable allantoicase n=1 Tax=Marinomonas phaeophyticola TaxID=3004091 RepID=A0ABT4JX14_9GAMM|nr:allantoicase [Marinomonas sp. 15G1-11]MCZ2722934.1 allantoicase [Marinomonas sp. 15G1-11]